jgi:hypothetical protein
MGEDEGRRGEVKGGRQEARKQRQKVSTIKWLLF